MTDVDAVARRSIARITDRLTEDAPCLTPDGDGVLCPFCHREMVVRRTILGTLTTIPSSGEQPHIDGVQLKCAGDQGCGFRPDFDVPLIRGHGYWPEFTHGEEFEREFEMRGDQRVVDMGYTPSEGRSLEDRLRDLGYLE